MTVPWCAWNWGLFRKTSKCNGKMMIKLGIFWVYPTVRPFNRCHLSWQERSITSFLAAARLKCFVLDVDTTRHSTLWVNPQQLSVAISWSFFANMYTPFFRKCLGLVPECLTNKQNIARQLDGVRYWWDKDWTPKAFTWSYRRGSLQQHDRQIITSGRTKKGDTGSGRQAMTCFTGLKWCHC